MSLVALWNPDGRYLGQSALRLVTARYADAFGPRVVSGARAVMVWYVVCGIIKLDSGSAKPGAPSCRERGRESKRSLTKSPCGFVLRRGLCPV